MWQRRTRRRTTIGKTISCRQRQKLSASRIAWIVLLIGLSTGTFLACFVAPFLGGDSSAFVNGFVETKPRQRSSSTSSVVASAPKMSVRKDDTITKDGKFQDRFFVTDEESLYRPSNSSDFETYGYDSNPTVFGSILRGEIPTKMFLETEELIAFEDIRPSAALHALVIPKLLIPSVLELSPSDPKSLEVVSQMSKAAHDLVRRKQPDAYRTGDYRLCFHIPPFFSVNHLHLHVLAPASEMKPWLKKKYNTGNNNNNNNCNEQTSNVRWCIGLSDVETNLQMGSPPTPYRRDDSWIKVLSDLATSIRSVWDFSFECE